MIFTLPLDAGLIALFLLTCVVAGRRAMEAAGHPPAGGAAEELLLPAGAGLLIVSLLTFAAGCLGLVYRPVLLGAMLLTVWSGRREIAAWAARLRGAPSPALSVFEKAMLGVLLAAALFNLLYNYSPPVAEDELSTHLGIPYRWAAANAVYRLPDAGSVQYYPSGVLMHYFFLAVSGSIQTARLFHYAAGLLCLGGVYLLARRFLGRAQALLAGAVFYTMPAVTSLSGVGNTDFGTLFYALLAVYSFQAWLSGGQTGRLLAAALFAGAHAACKYTGFPLLIIFPALIIWRQRTDLSRALRQTAVFAAGAFAVMAPYLVRNLILTGNPLYPKKFFGMNYHEMMYVVAFKGETLSGFFGRLGDLSLGNVIWGVGPLFAAFLPFIFVFRTRDEAGRDISSQLFVIAALNFLLLFGAGISFHLTRHSLLSFALLSVPVAGALAGMYSALNIRAYLAALLGLVFLGNLALPLYFGGKRLPVFLGLQSRPDYFDREYDIWEGSYMAGYINNNVPDDSGILFLGISLAPQLNYPRHRVTGMDSFSPAFYALEAPEALPRLERRGIKYIVYLADNFDRDAEGALLWKAGGSMMRVKWFTPEAAAPLAGRDKVFLYELSALKKILGSRPDSVKAFID